MSTNGNRQPKKTVNESNLNIHQPKKTVNESTLNRVGRSSFVRKDPLVGKTIGDNNRYLLQTLLGMGGMSKVYQALDTKFENRIVAIKLMTSYSGANNQSLVKRFMGEVKAISHLKHPNIIQILDFGVTTEKSPFNSAPFYVMEHFNGKTLQDFLSKNNKLPLNSSLKIIRQVCAGLEEAHKKGIVHRDLKPDNIFLVTGGAFGEFVKIIDFGIAKNIASNSQTQTQLTKEGSFIGTYRYASPEQCRGLVDIDQRTDIYSLGIILYEAISGRNPYNQDNSFDTQADWIAYHIKAKPKPLKEQSGCENIEDKINHIVMKCLAKSPEARFANIEELQKAFTTNSIAQNQNKSDTLQDTKLINGRQNDRQDLATEVEAQQVPVETIAETNTKSEETAIDDGSFIYADLEPNLGVVSRVNARKKISLKAIAATIAILIGAIATGSYLKLDREVASNSTISDNANINSDRDSIDRDDLNLVVEQLEAEYQKQNYQACYQLGLNNLQQDNNAVSQWVGKCGLEAAKIQANANSYSNAIAIAKKIPNTASNYREVTNNINTWSKNILDYATTVYKKGDIEQAIEVTKIVPENTQVKATIPELITKWQQQQQTHKANVEQAQNLLERGQWYDAKQEVEKIPVDFVFWRAKAQPILDRANQQIKEIAEAEQRRREQAEARAAAAKEAQTRQLIEEQLRRARSTTEQFRQTQIEAEQRLQEQAEDSKSYFCKFAKHPC